MATLNRVQIIGNLGKDPEIRTLGSGSKVASFSIASTETWTKDGEKKQRTEWINVSVFNEGLIKVIEKYVKKGSKLYVEGKFATRKYEKNGADHYATEVKIENFGGQIILLGDSGSGSGRSNDDGGGDGYQDRKPKGGASPKPSTDLDDDIPFAMEWRG